MFSDLSQFECNISYGFCRPDIGQIIMDKLNEELAKSTALPVGKYLIKTVNSEMSGKQSNVCSRSKEI